MRYFTHNVCTQLVRELDIAGAVKDILHDGGDIIHIQLITGESLMIYLIESPIPLYEIRNIITANSARRDHTLFILWGALLLPSHGRVVTLEDWQEGLMSIYGEKIYAYDVRHHEVHIYPVYFQRLGDGHSARVQYGRQIDVGALSPHRVQTHLPGLKGHWYIAAFDGDPDYYHRQQAEQISTPLTTELDIHYRLLQVSADDDLATVKSAYRSLARKYHPDVNAHNPAATRLMQQLNLAYNAILKARSIEQ